MGLKWNTRDGRFSDYYSTARFGHLTLSSDDIDGDNEPYSIYVENKGRMVPPDQRIKYVFQCDPHFGGADEARKRVEYLARCFFYGIPPIYTDWEKKNATIGDLSIALQRKPSTLLHGVWVRGIYYHPVLKTYVRVESIANVETNHSHPLAGLMTSPTVVFKDVYTDRLFARTVSDFLSLGFLLHSEVEDAKTPSAF